MSCEKGRQWQQALQLMEDMQDETKASLLIPSHTTQPSVAVGAAADAGHASQKGIPLNTITHTAQPSVHVQRAGSGSGRSANGGDAPHPPSLSSLVPYSF